MRLESNLVRPGALRQSKGRQGGNLDCNRMNVFDEFVFFNTNWSEEFVAFADCRVVFTQIFCKFLQVLHLYAAYPMAGMMTRHVDPD